MCQFVLKLMRIMDVKMIEILEITVPPRLRKEDGDIESLAENIEDRGLLEPIGVDREYVLIYGYRRLSACKLLGWETVPCIVHDVSPDDAQLLEIEENTHRQDFTDYERVHMIGVLREIYGRVPDSGTRFDVWAGVRLNIGKNKVSQLGYIFDHATEKQLLSLKQGETSVHKLYTRLKTQGTSKKRTQSIDTGCPLLEEYHIYYLAELFNIELNDRRLHEYSEYLQRNTCK